MCPGPGFTRHTRIIDSVVDRAECLDAFGHHLLDVFFAAGVSFDAEGFYVGVEGLELLGDGFEARFVEVGEDETCDAFVDEAFGGAGAYAGGRACYEGDAKVLMLVLARK